MTDTRYAQHSDELARVLQSNYLSAQERAKKYPACQEYLDETKQLHVVRKFRSRAEALVKEYNSLNQDAVDAGFNGNEDQERMNEALVLDAASWYATEQDQVQLVLACWRNAEAEVVPKNQATAYKGFAASRMPKDD